MKKIALVLVAAMVLVFTGCEKKETISMPFDVADVNNIEMYRNVVPNSAEKQVITKTDDIEDIYFLFSGLEVSDKKTEPVAGGTVTSFRFNLSNDTSYEIIYCAEAVKSGRLKLPEEKLDYFTAADIESYWDNYQYEIVPVSENELPGQEETQEWDKIPMVMVDGKLYYDTGKESTISGRCGVMDGEITSSVDGSEIPTKDNQSNFGTGFEYQYGADNTIEIFMNEKWIVFEQREGAGNQVRYGDRMVDAEGLSKELKAAVIRGAAAEQKVRELKVENQQLQQKIPSMKEKLKEAQERQRLENENRQLKVQVEYLEEDLSWERGISARLREGIGAVLDFLDQHLPEQFRPLVEKARELLPVPEVQQPEREQEQGHTWGGMEL